MFVDLPFLTYQVSIPEAIRNAGRVLQESNAHGVKLEGGAHMAETVHALVERGIPVIGHLGLTPQSVNALGGYRVQGRDDASAERLLADAIALETAGACAIVLELVPAAGGGTGLQGTHDSYNWYRCWSRVRWSGTGSARHARIERAVRSKIPEALCQAWRVGAFRRSHLCD